MSAVFKTLDQLGYVSRGRSRHRPRDAAHLYGGPYPFIQTGDVKHAGLYITSYGQTYSEAGLAQSKLWNAGTLCIAIAANTADTAILAFDACFPDSVIGFVPDEKRADARFVKYLFGALLQKRYGKFIQGAAKENLSQEKLLSLQFPVPSIEVQHRVADILAAYDRHIDNNRRRIQLLEQSARLLYKEWFVHLRFPGIEHVKVVNGVPDGWRKERLNEVAEINAVTLGSRFQGEIEYIDIASVTPGRINETTHYSFENAPGRARRLVRHGDIIWSCVRPGRESHAVIWNPPENLIASTGFAVLSPTAVPTSYLYQALMTREFVGFLSSNAKGAAYPAVTARDFENYRVSVPPTRMLTSYDEQSRPTLDLISVIDAQTRRLISGRDLLLPRLMSGEIEL
ncbi:MAG: hypothetical protein A3G81_25495 [Betaproteobacteria bacterium RIFCSPLOWO2_12_FULL_65_14]|nr:MAG: hypothetical protein A3G81_25495 [Betaproteobacteria bacterium RIFCSPLOWO2_12_FULL_65_14]